MDIQPKQPISDDQELAKVLAGITAGVDDTSAPANLADDLDSEAATQNSVPASMANGQDLSVAPMPDPVSTQSFPSPQPTDSGLESIKNDALAELRPLVDKLNVSAEEKFDTYLLLLRSTDDSTLVAPAFEAARAITDETEKAQALLDIVKEIDYLSNPQKQAV